MEAYVMYEKLEWIQERIIRVQDAIVKAERLNKSDDFIGNLEDHLDDLKVLNRLTLMKFWATDGNVQVSEMVEGNYK